MLPTDNRTTCPNSSVQDTSWYPRCRIFLNSSSHGLFALFVGSKFLSSWPLEKLHIHKSHAWVFPCVPRTGLDTVLKQHDPIACLSVAGQWEFLWVPWSVKLSLRAQLCSWMSTHRQNAYHCSSNPRTFRLIRRYYTNNGWDCKTVKFW